MRIQLSELPSLRQAQKKELKAETRTGNFGRNEQWIRLVREAMRQDMLSSVADMTETMKEDIVSILEKAIAEGWGIDKIVQMMRVHKIDARAKVIARTEIIRAANIGHALAASQTPYEVDKKWISAKDERVRKSHQYINGHIVDEGGYFNVPIYEGGKKIGTEPMLRPGDPEASGANTINCRCRVIFLPKYDTNGKLIMRDRAQAPVVQMRPPVTMIPSQQIAAILKSNIHIGVE